MQLSPLSLALGIVLGAAATFMAMADRTPSAPGIVASTPNASEQVAPPADGTAAADIEVRRKSGVIHRLSRMIRVGSDDRLEMPGIRARVRYERAGTPARTRAITRSGDRLVLEESDENVAWAYERNPISPSHFSAIVAVPSAKVLVEYAHAELVVNGIASDWNELACFGIAPRLLAKLRPTGETREAFGHRFDQLTAPDGAERDALQEVWWSSDAGAPLEATWGTGPSATRLVLEDLSEDLAASEAKLDPLTAHPDWRLVDACDWREEISCGLTSPLAGR